MNRGTGHDGEKRRAKKMDKVVPQSSELMLTDREVADTCFDFAEFANTAGGIPEVEAYFNRILKGYGIDNFILVQALDRAKKPTAAFMSGNSCEAWRRHYVKHELARKDELMMNGQHNPDYVTWEMFREKRDVSAEQVRIFNEASEFGLQDGLFIPEPQNDGSLFAVALLSQRKIERRFKLLASLHMMGISYSSAVRRLVSQTRGFLTLPGEKPVSLTKRQSECLLWVRAGKTDWEISQILGISEHTVIEHLEEARKRLNVKTRTQAVINAIHLGLIQP